MKQSRASTPSQKLLFKDCSSFLCKIQRCKSHVMNRDHQDTCFTLMVKIR
jgi:hypothetical protein